MISHNPVNMWIMHVDEFIKQNSVQQIKSHQIHEASTDKLHPEGLYSEEIFGERGTPDRLYKFGYVDLNTTIFHPEIFSNIIELRGMYKDVMAGKTYVKFDESLKDLVICTKDDPDAETGYQYFIEIFPKIEFKKTKSDKRNDKLRILEKYKDNLYITKCLVAPAGIRDLEMTDDGRFISEEINDVYRSLLSLSFSIPKNMGDHQIFNSVRYNIQLKVNAIVDYLFNNITDGKRGYFQGKYMARKLAGGTRNVIVSAILEGSDPDDPKYLKPDETYIPLFQAMRMYDQTMRYYLRLLFYNNTIGNNTNSIPAIDPDNGNLVYIDITDIERNMYMTEDGLNDFVNDFKNKEIRFNPVGIYDVNKKFHWLFMVYDTGKNIYIYRDRADLREFVERSIQDTSKIQYLSNLKDLGLSADEYVILGSACAILYGLDKINNDIDILVAPDALERIKPLLTKTDKGYTDTATGKIDVSDTSKIYESFEQAFVHSRIVDTYRFLDINGLYNFYSNLYNIFHMEKHKATLMWVSNLSKTLNIDPNQLRPLTICEMFYITAYSCMQLGHNQKHVLFTRYPVAHIESTYPSKTHLVTTSPDRLVKLSSLIDDNMSLDLPHYPSLREESLDAVALHPAWLDNLTADFDGDMGNTTGTISEEANDEIRKFMMSPASIVNTKGDLVAGIHDDTMIPWVLSNMSRDRIHTPIDLSKFKPTLSRLKGIDIFKDLMPTNQTILIGLELLTALGLTTTSGFNCIVSEYVFDVLGRSGKFEFVSDTNTFKSSDGLITVYGELPNNREYIYDQLIMNIVRIDSVLFLSPKIQYAICSKSALAEDKRIVKLYQTYLKDFIK